MDMHNQRPMSHRMLCSEPTPGCNVWPDVWPTESHEPWDGDEACVFWATTGRARQGVASPRRSGAHHGHRLVRGQTSLFLGTAPEVVPAPLGSPVWAVPAQCEFQTVAASLRACQQVPSACSGSLAVWPVLTSSSVHSWCRHISPTRGWPAGTYPLLLQLSPPTPRLTFLTPSHPSATRCTHLAAPIRIETRRQQ